MVGGSEKGGAKEGSKSQRKGGRERAPQRDIRFLSFRSGIELTFKTWWIKSQLGCRPGEDSGPDPLSPTGSSPTAFPHPLLKSIKPGSEPEQQEPDISQPSEVYSLGQVLSEQGGEGSEARLGTGTELRQHCQALVGRTAPPILFMA